MSSESFEQWKNRRSSAMSEPTKNESGFSQSSQSTSKVVSFSDWAKSKGIKVNAPQQENNLPTEMQQHLDRQNLVDKQFEKLNTPAPFFKNITETVSSMPGKLFSPIVAEAPSTTDNTAEISRTSQYEQDHPLSRLDNIMTSNIVKGYTGGVLHPESVAPKTFGEKVAGAFASGVGAVSAIQAIEKNIVGEVSTPKALKTFISKFPKVADYALPMVENAIKNIPGFALYGQLDPELKTTTDRLKKLAMDSSLAGTQSLLSPLPKLASVPLNGILFSGLAKLSGADDQDAAAQGVVGMLFDSLAPRLKVSKELTAGRVNNILGEKAVETINKYSTTKITPESSDIQIKQAYKEAIKATHPDLGGNLEDASSVNAAKDILLRDNTLPINDTITPKEDVIIPKDEQAVAVDNNVPSQVNENPVIVPTVQEAKLATEGNIMKDQSEAQQVQPQEQPNVNMGVSKTAERVAQNLVDSGVPVDFQNIAKYKKIDIEEGFAKVADLINNDFQKAVNIFSGKEATPPDINKTLLFEKMREYLIKNPDPELQYQILNSPELTAISESAQNMRLAQEINTESAIGKAQEIKKVRTKRVGNTKLDKIKNDIKSISRESKKVNLSKEDLAWDKFLDEITC